MSIKLAEDCWARSLFEIVAILLAVHTALAADEKPPRLWQFRETHLAVPVELRVYAAEEPSAKAAARAAYDRIDELNAIFSDYDADSEAMRLCRSDCPIVRVSPELFFVLTEADKLSQRTDGAFDVTVGPLVKQWRRARRKKELPAAEQIAAAKALVGHAKLKFNAADRTVEISQPGLQLDFGGVAKGYIAEEAYQALAANGCPRSLVGVAGDIFAGDPPPDALAWKIGVAPLDKPDGPPSRYLALRRQSASTSGDAFQFAEIDGVRYSHIVDPKTGLGLTERSSVTVIAPHGWQADALATAVCVLGREKGLKLIREFDDTDVLIATQTDGKEPETAESPGFVKRLWKDNP